MESEVEHDWEYIGNEFYSSVRFSRYEFRCKRCELSALCKAKKLNFLQVDCYKFPPLWDKNRINFVFGIDNKIGRGGKVIKNYFIGTPRDMLEPICISQEDWYVFDVLM